MIVNFVIGALLYVVMYLVSSVPQVEEFPFDMAQTVALASTYVHSFASVFWPLVPVISCFTIYLAIKIGMIPLRFFLGSRAPQTYAD